jgi:uncharacterized protein (TIGR03089 family)
LTPAELFAARVRANAADPLLTFYDDLTGERVELSATTTANWVEKTANLLQDGLAVEPGERVAVLLPLHWQAAVAMLACWSVGAQVTLDVGDADVVFAAEDAGLVEARASGARDVVGLSLLPLGQPLTSAPTGVTDFAREVLGYPDDFVPYARVDDGTPALRVGADEWTGRALVADATEAAAQCGMHSRLLTAVAYDDAAAIRLGLLAPIAAGGSLVLCRNLDESKLADRARVERVTVTLGATVDGVRRIG